MQAPYIIPWPSWQLFTDLKATQRKASADKYADINVSTVVVLEKWLKNAFTKCSRIIQLLLNGNCVKPYF